jgi:hypothetical protein
MGLFGAAGEPFQPPQGQLGAEAQAPALGPYDQALQVPPGRRVVVWRVLRRVEAAGQAVAGDLAFDQADEEEPAAGGTVECPREATPQLGDQTAFALLPDCRQRGQVGARRWPNGQARWGGGRRPARLEGGEAAVRRGTQERGAKAG